MPWYNEHPSECPLVWVDTETGGLDTTRVAMLEIAIIVTDFTGKTVRDRWQARLMPFHDDLVETEAARTNGYDWDLWMRTAIGPRTAVDAILHLAHGGIMAGHNPRFDSAVLLRFLRRYGITRWPGPRYHADTVGMAWPLLATRQIPDLKLTTLTSYLGIDHEHAHTAMSDCEAARLVYCSLLDLYRRGSAPELLTVGEHPA